MSQREESRSAVETLESAYRFGKRGLMFWKRALLAFVVLTAIAVPAVMLRPRSFRSESTILYQQKINLPGPGGGEGESVKRVTSNLRERLFSRTVLEPFVNDVPRYRAIAERRGMVEAIDELRSHIGLRAREGDMLEISYEASDPVEARDVTRRLADRLVELSLERTHALKATRELLDADIQKTKQELDASQTRMSGMLVQNPSLARFLTPGQGPQIQIVGPNEKNGTGTAGTARDSVLAQLEAERAQLQRDLGVQPEEKVEESEAVRQARTHLAEVRGQYTEQHPDVVAAKRQLQEALAAAAKQQQPKNPGLSADQRAKLETRLAEVRAAIARHKAASVVGRDKPGVKVAPPPVDKGDIELELEFRRVQHDVERLKENLSRLDQRLFDVKLAADALKGLDVRVFDAAYLPTHATSKPRSVQLALALFAAFAFAVFLALGSARLDDRIHAVEDLERLDDLPVLGVILPAEGTLRRRRHAA